MTVKEEIMSAITQFPGLTDAELKKRFDRRHQTINAACQELVKQGRLVRQTNYEKNGNLGNYPAGDSLTGIETPKKQTSNTFDEDAVKSCISNWLEKQGWSVKVAWGKTHGVDIEAHKGCEHWLIEVKGPGSLQAMQHNYFLGILGETLQRMDDSNARYSIAFPDMKVYRNLWSKLPALAKQRTGIDMLLVDTDGTISVLK